MSIVSVDESDFASGVERIWVECSGGAGSGWLGECICCTGGWRYWSLTYSGGDSRGCTGGAGDWHGGCTGGGLDAGGGGDGGTEVKAVKLMAWRQAASSLKLSYHLIWSSSQIS